MRYLFSFISWVSALVCIYYYGIVMHADDNVAMYITMAIVTIFYLAIFVKGRLGKIFKISVVVMSSIVFILLLLTSFTYIKEVRYPMMFASVVGVIADDVLGVMLMGKGKSEYVK